MEGEGGRPGTRESLSRGRGMDPKEEGCISGIKGGKYTEKLLSVWLPATRQNAWGK